MAIALHAFPRSPRAFKVLLTANHLGLDGELQKHRYVACETLTAPDFALIAPFCHAERARFPLEPYRAIARWVADMTALPAWSKTTALQR